MLKLMIAAGGTGGHIFPALAVVGSLRRKKPAVSFLWIGTGRSREKELCERYNIPFHCSRVIGMNRKGFFFITGAAVSFFREIITMLGLIRRYRPDGVLAFGGYVSAPLLTAARLCRISYVLQEQNTVPGWVTRIFASHAARICMGFTPVSRQRVLPKSRIDITGVPVRNKPDSFKHFSYPDTLDLDCDLVLICGGSQGARSMNAYLIEPVLQWVGENRQIVWQTGKPGFSDIAQRFQNHAGVFLFDTLDDLYPYYARARFVIGRAGASTLAEIALFELPCICIPLPWATDDHQWYNAGCAEEQGWCIRIRQDDSCPKQVRMVGARLFDDDAYRRSLSEATHRYQVGDAADRVADDVIEEFEL